MQMPGRIRERWSRARGTGIAAALLAAVTAIGGMAATAEAQVTRYSVATGSPTSGYYRMASPAMEYLNRTSEKLRITPLSTDGSLENCRRVASGSVKFGMCTTLDLAQAWTGTGAFDAPQRSFRIVGPDISAIDMYFFVRKDSDIQKFADLAGKTFGCGAAGSSAAQICRGILDALGLSDKIEIIELPFDQLADMLANRDIDGMARGLVGRPSGFASELNSRAATRILDLGEFSGNPEMMAKIPAVSATTLREGLYDFQPAPLNIVSIRSFFIVHKDVPADHVEEFARVLNSQAAVDHMANAFAGHGLYPKDPNPLAGLLIPLSPGAETFWKTTGVDIPKPTFTE